MKPGDKVKVNCEGCTAQCNDKEGYNGQVRTIKEESVRHPGEWQSTLGDGWCICCPAAHLDPIPSSPEEYHGFRVGERVETETGRIGTVVTPKECMDGRRADDAWVNPRGEGIVFYLLDKKVAGTRYHFSGHEMLTRLPAPPPEEEGEELVIHTTADPDRWDDTPKREDPPVESLRGSWESPAEYAPPRDNSGVWRRI